MGSYVAMDGKGNLHMKASGKVHAGSPFTVNEVSVSLPEILHVESYPDAIQKLTREKIRADTGHYPKCAALYPGGFCDC